MRLRIIEPTIGINSTSQSQHRFRSVWHCLASQSLQLNATVASVYNLVDLLTYTNTPATGPHGSTSSPGVDASSSRFLLVPFTPLLQLLLLISLINQGRPGA